MIKGLPEEDLVIARLMAESDDCKWDYPEALRHMYEMHVQQKRYQAWKIQHEREVKNKKYTI